MADELNTPTHRWYEPRNNISLPKTDFSAQTIYDSGIQKIDAWINSQPWGSPVPGLFALAEPGAWYDPSDLTTLFQDAAGTTPVAAAGQPVGLMLDKSGNGNHATQATAASRPTYGIVPLGGRRNLLTRTEEFNDAAWTKTSCTVTNQGGGVWRLQASAASTWLLSQLTNLDATGTVTFDVKSNGAGLDAFRLMVDGGVSSGLTATSDWSRLSFSRGHVTTGSTGITRDVANSAVDILIRFPQFETGSSATAYQRVGSAFDVTESGVASLSYLSFDGVDDFLVTPTITPNIDKAQVFAGVRKRSDAARGMVAELSTTTANNGSFGLEGPGFGAGATYSWTSKGTSNGTVTPTGFASPITSVLTGLGDISGDLATLRVNGTEAAQSTADQGTGNFLAYPLYIGRRAGTTLPFNGQLYGLITRFGANLDANTISQTETWVNSKTGAY